jgi:hypothetical protein
MYFGMQLLSFVIFTHILGNRGFCKFIACWFRKNNSREPYHPGSNPVHLKIK